MNIKTIVGILLLLAVPLSGGPYVRIYFVQVPHTSIAASNEKVDGYATGSRIVWFTAGEKEPVVLTGGFWSACDPVFSFEGKRILFAGKRKQGDFWQIWQMDYEGGNKKQITHIEADCISPAYVGALFHLNDKKPTRQLAYMRGGHIYTCEMDGRNQRRISYGPAIQPGLEVLPNGRILFSRGKDLYSLNIDGTDLMGYVTAEDFPGRKEMVRVGKNGFVYFAGRDGVVRVLMYRPARSARVLKGNYQWPCPLGDGIIIVSKKINSLYSLILTNQKFLPAGKPPEPTETGTSGIFYQSKTFHCIDAQLLTQRPQVRGRSSFVAHQQTSGILYCLDVYISRSQLKPGTVKRVQVTAGERLLGEAPVEPDGSFHIRVPARTPLTFSLLDAQGKTLSKQKKPTWVMPRESRGCIGCHEDPELAPPNKLAEAIKKPAVDLTIKKERRK